MEKKWFWHSEKPPFPPPPTPPRAPPPTPPPPFLRTEGCHERTITQGHAEGVVGQFARMLKMATRKRQFWWALGHLASRLKNCHKDQICSKWSKPGRNPVDKAILEGFWNGSGGPGQEAENVH